VKAPDTIAPAPPPLTLLQKAGGLALFIALIGAGLTSFASYHLPSPLGVQIALAAACAAGAWSAWECRRGGAYDVARPRMSGLKRFGPFRVVAMAVFATLCVFSFVEDGLLALDTGLVGAPGSRTLTVTRISHSSRSCDHFDVREVGWLLDRALCASSDELRRARRGDQLMVFGRKGPFGLNVERHELRRPPQS
jgi:hypothetical protein